MFFSGNIKRKKALKMKNKKALQMTSQLVIFTAFFCFFSIPPPPPPPPPDLKSEKTTTVNRLIKKFWPNYALVCTLVHPCDMLLYYRLKLQ